MSPYEVAEEVVAKIPTKKWIYLWIRPSSIDEQIDDYLLTPPFTSAGWVCVGKIWGRPKYNTKEIVLLTFHIKWIMQMYQSFSATID